MSKLTRRDFIKRSLVAGSVGIVSSLPTTAWSNVVGANDDIRVAVVGLKGKGAHHVELFRRIDGVRVAALCDPDEDILAGQVKRFKDRNEKVDTYADVRKLLDDDSIDAIVIATPDHWHALITIWACQAGKDVYVEKPVCHNICEGRKMVEAARKYNRIVQTGTQRRSDAGMQEAIKYIQDGKLGKIVVARGICYRRRKSIGKVAGPQPIPESVDYDLWTGPAPLVPLMREKLHYDWHWDWSTGTGEVGNNGVHFIDVCRWALGENSLAERVMSIGGRFGYVDDGQTPNTSIVILDYAQAPIILEVRGLTTEAYIEAMDHYRGVRFGNVIECEHGYFDGGFAYDKNGNKIKQFLIDGGRLHQANFIEAMRSRKQGDLNADILEGHLSTALCHMGNISHRIGELASQEEIQEKSKAERGLTEAFERFQEHLIANGIDLSENQAVLGPLLRMDSGNEKFIGSGAGEANGLLRRNYRKPFVVPEKV